MAYRSREKREVFAVLMIAMTMRYAHPTPESKRKAVEILTKTDQVADVVADGDFAQETRRAKPLKRMEAAPGFEPGNNGFADRRLSHLAMPPPRGLAFDNKAAYGGWVKCSL